MARALVRAWVRVYTSGMPLDLRDARRAEVDSDLWEHDHDARAHGVSRAMTAIDILVRTLLGVPDDIGWRLDAWQERRAAPDRRVGTMPISVKHVRWMGLCGVLSGVLWVGVLGFEDLGRVDSSATAWHYGGPVGYLILSGAAVALLCLMLATPGFYTQQRTQLRMTGAVLGPESARWPGIDTCPRTIARHVTSTALCNSVGRSPEPPTP